MSEKTIYTEPEVGQVVICPSCYQQNRLYPQVNQGICQCGHCRTSLPNPFISPKFQTQSTIGRKAVVFVIVAGVFLAGAGLLNFAREISSTGNQSTGSQPSPATISRHSSPKPAASPLQPVASSPSVPLQNRSLPSSKVLIPLSISGDGSLKVSNGTSRDAYLKLVDPASRKLVTAFYVKSKSDFTLKQIPDGKYQILFMSGEDWDAKAQSFTRNRSLQKFDQLLDFKTMQVEDQIRYMAFDLTLNPVPGGNATTSGLDE